MNLIAKQGLAYFLSVLFTTSVHAGVLADAPLNVSSSVPSNVLFALSVEFPTAITPAYRGTYSASTTYKGYFDEKKCYDYREADTRFNPANKDGPSCAGKWSGNWLNWASMSALDEFRSAMTGGDRFLDTPAETVLQRSFITNNNSLMNKTHTAVDGSTPYPTGTALTITNQNKGHKMNIALGASRTARCQNPVVSGSTFTCDVSLTTGETGSCTTWTGTGTDSSPYKCTSFGTFTSVGTPNPAAGTPGALGSFTTGGSRTVTCSSPTFTSGVGFSCAYTNDLGITGTCDTPSGTGSASDPFSCSSFNQFGSSNFTASYSGTATTFSATSSNTQTVQATSCSLIAGPKITCNLPNSRTLTCSSLNGNGGGTAYRCSGTPTISGSGNPVYESHTNKSSTGSSPNKFRPVDELSFITDVSETKYYVPSYTGSDASAIKYYSDYQLSFTTNSDFWVRVKVCSTDDLKEKNCVAYGSSLKPVGEIQNYGEKMRFGVFSYYNKNDIDNAVMRSKLKYVAPEKWTSSGTNVTNANREWSISDGSLVANPDSADATASYGGAVSQSGVINYINKFGNDSQKYKTYDNVGKLYYEALKYLRGGKNPTTAFYEKAPLATGDGFPIITSWDDPVLYSCQKNFIITLGDKNTHCDKRLPGGTSTAYGSGQCTGNSQTADQGDLSGDTDFNVTSMTNALGTLEGNANLATTFGFAGTASFYMSGMAYWAAKDGFRVKDGVKVKAKSFVIDVWESGTNDGAPTGTGTLQYGSQYWLAAKYGGADSFDSAGKPVGWAGTIPSYSGAWPKTLLPANNPENMQAAIRSAFSAIAALSGSGSSVGVSTGDLRTSNGTTLFSATYDPKDWSGDLLAIRLSSSLDISLTPTWSASTLLNPTSLNAGSPKKWTTRNVFTYNDGLAADGTASGATNARKGVIFSGSTFDTNLSPRQQAFLNIDPGSLADDSAGSFRVDYLLGDNTNESVDARAWRLRTKSIGDFIDSAPLYVRFPSSQFIPKSDFTSFKAYATAISSRDPVVYAGSNGGMLHAFNAKENSDGTAVIGTSGTELMAYVPSAVYKNLNLLTWPNYSHRYYVNGSPVMADVPLSRSTCATGSDITKCWSTLITGGLGAGGKGIYALDGTNPSAFSASSVLWEFTDRDDQDLGYTFAQPVVRKMNNGKWAVIVGNGYNNTTGSSSNGRAYLFIFDVDGPGTNTDTSGKPWVLGTNYQKIELIAPNEGNTPLNPANGLSTAFPLDKDDNGTVDYIYAGDRYGNLWKIDVSSTSPADWKPAFGTSTVPQPLFTAQTGDTTPVKQQITTSPFVSPHPQGGYLVMFGTGSYVDIADPTSPFTTNTFYGIWDKDDAAKTRITSRGQLQKQATLAKVTDGDQIYVMQSDCKPQYADVDQLATAATATCPSTLAPTVTLEGNVAQQLGWMLDLANDPTVSNSGERYISSTLPIIENGLLTFVSLTTSADVCTPGGYDLRYDLDYLTGGAFPKPVYYNLSPTSAVALKADFSVNGVSINAAPSGMHLKTAIGQNPKRIYYQTDKGKGTPGDSGCSNMVKGRPCLKTKRACDIVTATAGCSGATPPATGRVSWRQITQ